MNYLPGLALNCDPPDHKDVWPKNGKPHFSRSERNECQSIVPAIVQSGLKKVDEH
jgi:hypothetical protein